MKKITYIFLLILISFSAFSQKASKIEIQTVLKNFLLQENKALLNKDFSQISILSEDKKEIVAYAFNYPNSFVIISANKYYSPIKAFSFGNNYISENNISDDNISLQKLL